MKEIIVKRLGALLSVKSLVTLLLSGVFAYLAITGQTSQEFMTVYTVVIAFYFGTQTQKISDAVDKTLKGPPESLPHSVYTPASPDFEFGGTMHGMASPHAYNS